MSFYSTHVFVCTHDRVGASSCRGAGASDAVVDELRHGVARHVSATCTPARVSRSGCMGRCTDGPVLVIYPDATWYRYSSEQDLLEIIDSHFMKRQIATRLQLVPHTSSDKGIRDDHK